MIPNGAVVEVPYSGEEHRRVHLVCVCPQGQASGQTRPFMCYRPHLANVLRHGRGRALTQFVFYVDGVSK